MSDLAATGCGCGSGNGIFGNGLFGGGDCCNSGCGGNNFIWIIILIALLG